MPGQLTIRRMRWFLTVPVLIGLAGPLFAECPPPPDHGGELADLIDEARAAENEAAGRDIGQEMWALWATAPDPEAQAILDAGMRRRDSYDFLGALQEFDRLVDYCPDYAEGYNQRAFVNFLSGNFQAAVPDLERALELSPDHVAARSGLALTLLQLGRLDEARTALTEALARNPWLSERHLMADGGPLALPGEDL